MRGFCPARAPERLTARGHNPVTSSLQMKRPERLTIDTTIAIDLLDSSRQRHAAALKLAAMAEAGDVELGVAPQGHRLDYAPDLVDTLRRAFPQVGSPSYLSWPTCRT